MQLTLTVDGNTVVDADMTDVQAKALMTYAFEASKTLLAEQTKQAILESPESQAIIEAALAPIVNAETAFAAVFPTEPPTDPLTGEPI